MNWRKFLKWSAGVFIVLLAALSITLLISFNRIEDYINENGKELIGRKVHLKSVGLNLLNAKVFLKGFTIYESNEKDTFITSRKVAINLNLKSLLEERYVVEELLFDGLKVRVFQDSGVFSFQDLVDSLKTTGDADSLKPNDAKSWEISSITIENSELSYYDKALPYDVIITELDIQVPSGISNQKQDLNARAQLILNEENSIDLNFKFRAATDSFRTEITFGHLGFDMVQPFFENTLNFKELLGEVNANLAFTGSAQNPADFMASGTFSLDSFGLINFDGHKQVGFRSLAFTLDSLSPIKDVYEVSKVTLFAPYGDFHLYQDGHNFQSLTSNSITDTFETDIRDAIANLGIKKGKYIIKIISRVKETVKEYRANNIHAGIVDVVNGDFNFYDHTSLETFKCRLQNVNIITHDYYFEKDSVVFDIKALLNYRADLSSSVVIYPSRKGDFSLQISINNFSMKDLNPYTYSYIGHRAISGYVSLKTKIEHYDNYIHSTNYLKITGLLLNKKDRHENATKLPVKPALKVLTDENGILELIIPLNGNLNDPDFQIGPLIGQALTNTLQKASSLPNRAAKRFKLHKKQEE